MNTDTLSGAATQVGGRITEALGDATGDSTLRGEGMADRASGAVQETIGTVRDKVSDGVGPLVDPIIDQVRRFARERPFAAALVAGVIGIALLNTLRAPQD